MTLLGGHEVESMTSARESNTSCFVRLKGSSVLLVSSRL